LRPLVTTLRGAGHGWRRTHVDEVTRDVTRGRVDGSGTCLGLG